MAAGEAAGLVSQGVPVLCKPSAHVCPPPHPFNPLLCPEALPLPLTLPETQIMLNA